MNTRREQGEPERREGLGGRVRRFIDSELGRTLDKDNQGASEETTEYRQAHDRSTESDRRQENVHRNVETSDAGRSGGVGESGDVGRPVMKAPVAEYDSTAHDSRAAGAGVEEPVPAPGSSRARSADAADGSAVRVGLLNDPAGLRNEWQQVQGTFVDDPQRAVHDASVLVERTLREIHENVSRGQINDPTSTEELRVSFQRYREFFQRLLSA